LSEWIALLFYELTGTLVGALFPHPRRATSRVGVTLLVLAALVAFFVPASAGAGTETTTMRSVTTGALLVAGIACIVAHGGFALFAVGLTVVVLGGVVAHAPWLFWLAAAAAAAFAICSWIEHVKTTPTSPPAIPDTPTDGESATDIIESVATAFILALVVREFAFEAFKIPTGSMEPTIYGEGYGRRKGDRLLAAKSPLLFADPDRWSIVVFKYPLFRPTNFIKRLVGLPGERLEIRDGDIYVNGKVVAKPEQVQDSLWFPLLPNESGEWPAGGVGQSFHPDAAGQWHFDADGATATVAAEKTSWIVHDAGFGDVRASFDVDAAQLGDGAVLVRIEGSGRRVDLEARRDELWLTAPGVERTKLKVDGLGTSSSRLGLGVADRVVRVWRDGRLVARIESADTTNAPGRGEQTWIGVTNATVKLAKITLEHDLQYSGQGPGTWDIPEGRFFMLGDNTRASRDSRLWQGKVFRTKDGAEYVADDSVRLDDEQSVVNVRDAGDAYDFHDSYGVKRHVAKDDLVDGIYKVENQPFVRREDLVGRAFFIFFPFPPAGEWRPRILP
jgi:signal peptidase I